MTTIKEHLDAARLEFNILGGIELPIGKLILEHLAAIEAKLDAPMKSAEEWFCEINYDDWSNAPWETQTKGTFSEVYFTAH